MFLKYQARGANIGTAKNINKKTKIGKQSPEEHLKMAKKDNLQSIDTHALNRIRDLQSEDDPNIFEEIIHVYLTSAEDLVAQLADCDVENDHETVLNLTHSLKSSSANVGALSLYDISKELEIGCRKNTLDNAEDLISSIAAEFIRVKDALNKEICTI